MKIKSTITAFALLVTPMAYADEEKHDHKEHAEHEEHGHDIKAPNGGRVLLLLRDKGALKLKDGVGFKPTIADIVENPKKLKIVEIDAAQTPRTPLAPGGANDSMGRLSFARPRCACE